MDMAQAVFFGKGQCASCHQPPYYTDNTMHDLKVDRFYKKMREFREMVNEAEINKVKAEICENRNKKAEIELCYKDLRKFCRALGLNAPA